MKTVKRVLTIAMCAALMLTSAPLSGFVGLDLPSLFDFSFSFNAQGMEAGEPEEWSTEKHSEEWTEEWSEGWSGEPITYPPEIETEPPVVEEPTTRPVTVPPEIVTYPPEIETYPPEIETLPPVVEPPINVLSGTCGDNLTWDLDTSTNVLNISGTGEMYEYDDVSSAPWYSYCCDIEKIIIGSGVESVSSVALACCDNLTSIYVDPDSKYFSNDAFGVLFNKDKTVLLKYPAGNERTIYKIPESVSVIGEYAFAQMKYLSAVGIPESVTDIERYAFMYSWNLGILYSGSQSQLEYINVEENSGIYESNLRFNTNFGLITVEINYEGVFSTPETLPLYVELPSNEPVQEVEATINREDFITSYTDVLIYKFDFTEDEFYIVPESVVFVNDNGEEMLLPTTVKYGGYCSYYFKCTVKSKQDAHVGGSCGDNLSWSLNYDTGVLNITGTGEMTNWTYESPAPWYLYRDYIKTVNISNGVTTIGDNAFCYCTNLTSVSIPESICCIGYASFESCESLESIVLPENLQYIYEFAFWKCSSLATVSIPASVMFIGNAAFADCYSLNTISVDSENQYYSSDDIGALYNKEKTIIYQYPIGNTAKTYNIASTVSVINERVFACAEYLETVYISASVTSVGYAAFYDCEKLCDIYYNGAKIQWNEIYIEDGNYSFDTATIHFKDVDYSGNCGENLTWILDGETGALNISGTGEMYNFEDGTEPWYRFKRSILQVVVENGVTTIGDGAFFDCNNLKSVMLGDDVTTIGDRAFCDCYNLTSIAIPDSVKTIGDYAFEGCFSLTSVTIPDSVTTIGNSAFRYCYSLTSVTIPDSVTTIGDYAFQECSALINATIGNGVESIGDYAFGGCFELSSVTIGNGVKSVGYCGFALCVSLTSITIPDSVTAIGGYAFAECGELTSVIIGNSVATIGEGAFCYCTNLTSVTIPDSVTTIRGRAFEHCDSLTDVYYGSTEEDWSRISIGEENESLLSAAIHFNECEHPEDQLSWETVKDATCAPGLEVATCGVCGKRGGKKTVVCDSSTYPESEHNYADGINQTWNFSYPGAKKLILKFSDLTETESCCDYIYLYDSNGCYIGLYFGTYLSGETIEIEGSGFSIELISDYSVNYYGFSFDSISAVVDNDLNRVIPAVSEHDWSNKDGVCANGCGTECTHPDGTQGACDACGYSCAVSGHIIRSDGKCSLCGKTGGTCYENLTWIFDETTGTLTISGTGELYYYDFNYTEAPWYEYYSSIKTIIIGDGVTDICDSAFCNYYNLTNVTIGNGVATIGAHAFEYCERLASVTIGNNATTIGDYAFYGCCSLTSVTIPDSVTTIGDYAFENCSNLTNVTLGKGLTQIGAYVFNGCNVLSEINVNEANENYCSVDGVLYSKNKTVIVAYPAGKKDKEFTIPDTVKEIGAYSFAGCNNLQTLYIPESVTTIGAYAFESCYNLNIVFSSNEFTSIGDYAFAGCTFTSFVIPEGIESIGNYAFAYCYSLEEIVIPDSVTAIGENAFEWCSSLKTIDIPDSVKTIGSYAFYECYSLETVKLGNGIDEIPQSMFGYCYALKEIEIPNGVTSIGTGAFYYCENLNTVIIPESVSTIDAEAFAVCKSLKSFEVSAENDKFCSENGVLFNKDKTKIISYPAGKTDKTYIIPSYVTSIESYAFSASKNLYYITIPSTVTSIGEYAFAYSNLVSLFLEDGITKVTSYSFTHCEKLASVTISATVTLIEDNAFNCCRSLKEIYYYGSERDWQAVEIGSNNFLANVKMYYLDSAADTDYVFANGELIVNGPEIVSIKFADMDFADEIVKVTVKSGVSKILPFVFADLPNLTEVNISKSVFYIGDFAFENCVNLESVNLDAEFDDETVEEESSGYIEEPWGEISDPDIGLMEEAPYALPTLPPVNPTTTIPYTEYPSSLEESTVREEEYSEYTTFDDRPTRPATTNPQPSEEEYSSDNRLIGIMAFAGCANLENIVVPGTFKTVGNYAFADCTKLADVTLENGIETIGCAAFNNCTSLSEIAIPESTKRLGYDAFYGCSSLETVYYNAIDCYLFGASESALIAFGERESIKNFIFGNKVETIPNYLLRENAGITEIDIPDSVTTIGDSAFAWCDSLTSVSIGNSVTTIGNYAFSQCYNLTSVTIPDSVTTIGGCAFCGCTSLTSIKIPDSVTAIGWGAFSSCDNIESITVNAKNEYYSSDSYGVLFNKDKTCLIQYPAANKKLSYDIPETVVTIYDEAFFCCKNLINVTIPEGVTDIYSYAFANCTRLKSIALPDCLTEISWCAFFNCSNLTSVAIPESVTDIYYAAFSECYSLSDVYYNGSEEQWEEIYITADNTPLLSANIHFNSEPLEPDKIIASGVCGESLNWVLYDDGILEISGKGAMHDFEDGTEPWYRFKNTILQVIVEDGVTTIGDGAFFDCPNLKSVTLGADITSIGFEAFKCCGNITDVYYNGTTEQWNSISIDKYNEDLTNAALHFKPQQQTSNCKISIKRPDVKNVNYGDTLMFEAVVNNLPQGAKIVWKVSGASAKLKVAEDGMSCTVRVTGAGELKVSASVVSEQGVPYKNANGNNIASHKTFTAKAGFWEFIIWIFKSIFGTTPVYPPETLL